MNIPLLPVAALLRVVALQQGFVGAGMRREGGGGVVSLPDIHFGTAGTVLAGRFGPRPANGISRTVDKFHVVRALGVAITWGVFS